MANITNNKISFYISGSEIMSVSSSTELLTNSNTFAAQQILLSQSLYNTSSIIIQGSKPNDTPSSLVTNSLGLLILSQSNRTQPISIGTSLLWDSAENARQIGIVNSGYVNLSYKSFFMDYGSPLFSIYLRRGAQVPDYYSPTFYSPDYRGGFGNQVWLWPYGNQVEFGNGNTGKTILFNNNQLIINPTIGIPTTIGLTRLYVGVGNNPKMYTQVSISGNLNFTGSGNFGLSTTTISVEKLQISGNVIPYIDNASGSGPAMTLGNSSNLWNTLYAVNGTILTSDKSLKTNIKESSLGLQFIKELNPVKFRYKNGERIHYGLIAQEIKDLLDKNGIDTKDFAGYVEGSEGNKFLRYEEFISPLIKAIQELSAKINILEQEIKIRGIE